MPQPMAPAAPAPKEGDVATHDPFGMPLNKETPAPVPEISKPGGEKKPEFDVATHPVVQDINKKLEDVGKNATEQRKIIDRLTKENKALKENGGKKEDDKVTVPYPEIKRSKDLTEDQREEMTANEIRLMDEAADAKAAANKMVEDAAKEKGKDKDEDDGEGEALKPSEIIAAEAKILAGGNAEKEREILEAARLTSFNGLRNKEDIIARLKLGAEKFIPNWQPPKEQVSPTGATSIKTGADASDPYGNNKIVQEARQGSTGNYSL